MRKFLVLLVLALALSVGCSPRQPETPAESSTTPLPTEAVTPAEPVCLSPEIRGTVQCLESLDNRCLAVYRMETGACKVMLYDLSSGELLSMRTVPDGFYQAKLLPDGSAVLLDRNTGLACRYDSRLEQCLRQEESWGQQWLLQDGGYLWALDAGGQVRRTSLVNGARRQYQLSEDGEYMLIGFRQGQTLIWSADTEESTFWLDWETGALTADASWNNSILLWQNRIAAVYSTQDEWILRPLGADEVYLLPERQDCTLLDLKGQTLLLSEGPTGPLEVWDLLEGKMWTGPASQWSHCILTGSGLVYATCDDGVSSLYQWDYLSAESAPAVCQRLTQKDLEARNRAMAAAIRQKTGIRVHYGKQGAAFNDPYSSGYVGQVVDAPVSVYLALKAVSNFTDRYPEGIFREMVVEPLTGLELYLSGALSPDGEQSVDSAYGFSTTMDDVRIVVMNLDLLETKSQAYFEQSLAHEFMHVMEDRIYACAQERGIEYLNYWEFFTPGQGAYYYSYFDENGLEISDPTYTAAAGEIAGSQSEVWFLDSYSRSYPLEDRARILEYLYAGEDGLYAEVFQEPHIQAKAQYLCAVIRDCFPSCTDAERLPWETFVDPAPFSRYLEAVMAYEPLALG